MSDSAGITDQLHNDYVGTDANVGRIPGAEKATAGHLYIEVFPKGQLLTIPVQDFHHSDLHSRGTS